MGKSWELQNKKRIVYLAIWGKKKIWNVKFQYDRVYFLKFREKVSLLSLAER